MDFNKKYGSTDPKRLAKWFKLDGAEFFIAPSNNIAFKKAALKYFTVKDVEGALNSRPASELVEMESAMKAEAVLLDWKGVKDGDTEVVYAEETAKQYLVDYEDFRLWVDDCANKLATDKTNKTTALKKTS